MLALWTVAVRRSTIKISKSQCKVENLLCHNVDPDPDLKCSKL